ncbi:late embryogenesis abundant protein At1g64065-like [Rosa rugosa]|uniref:late embryogenesis abundant protein At1g64065-like n=1 Tax=Rosa rugosa TaxID=74645 RepID=UPI002B4014D4|nr:late embryogenesis abundant protein At1g64065-like [Rosa rugosa]
MAEKKQEAYPFAPYANGQAMARSDAKSSRAHSDDELRRKKRIKCLIYIVVFAVFQIIVITVLALTVMRVKSPKFRIQAITVEELNTTSNPSLTMRFIAEVSVKNPNFGRYKYDQTSISFIYKGTQVGDAVVPQETARTKATRKTIVSGAVTTINSNLASDISSGSMTLSTYSKINGKVYLMNMIKKKKSAEMKCTMIVNLTTKQVHDIKCN